jgi:uncharacterized protein YcbK (DUF882 family)
LAGVSTAGLLFGTAPSQAAPKKDARRAGDTTKHIALRSLHTGERLDIEYFRDGAYLPAALSAIEVLLRDFRTGERHAIDPSLMDYLLEVAHAAGVDPAFSVISGYRSPRTNAQLREKSTGVARRSLHMEGRAIDVRLTGVDCASLASRAQILKRGGVGYYRASDFVHLDTGAFRIWKG